MDDDLSYLSSLKYGYDFVVSTTEATINSDLLAYLAHGTKPIEYICFLVDPQTGNPTEQISLDDLLQLTGGVNPFNIPAGTPYDDPQVKTLAKNRFVCGVKIQIGLPAGVPPTSLPPVVRLGNAANNVAFNLFCSEFTVIQLTPGNDWGGTGQWDVWSQDPSAPWYVETRIDLVMADLDKELDTPYFNSHPDVKAQLKRQLMNLSSSAFSLQQLLFDLDSALLQTVPTFEGVPKGSNAELVLQKSFVSIYSTSAKTYGWPLVSVTAVSQSPDPSQLQMTGFERQVSQLKDGSGNVIQNPTKLQQSCTTLDYLCAAEHHPLPGTASFNWNWILPQDIDTKSGVISINRTAIGNYIMKQILPLVKPSCIKVECSTIAKWTGSAEYDSTITPEQTPQNANIKDSGADVIGISYKSHDKGEDWGGATYAGMSMDSTYDCDVTFQHNKIVITQHLLISIWVCWDSTSDSCNIFDQTLTSTYSIEADQYGGLQTTMTDSKIRDHSQSPDLNSFVNFFTGVNDIINDLKGKVSGFASLQLKNISFSELQNFVFPGAKVFTFKGVKFSQYQDLVCDITYADPSAGFPSRSYETSLAEVSSQAKGWGTAMSTDSILALTYSCDMMQNYVHGELVSPTGKFEALQTDDGHTLLFAIDTSGVFHVIEEMSGITKTGWRVRDLSTAIIKAQYPGNSDAVVRTFDVGQSALDGSIGLLMAVSSGGTDNLFISLYNYSSDTSWTAKPNWTPVPFDAVTERPKTITITGAFFAEVTGKQQYIVVDVDRFTDSVVKDIARYHIDPSRSTGSYWVKHDVPIDIGDGSYQSCVGRVSNDNVDGIYTSGKAGGVAQFVYVPIINAFGSGPAMPIRFSLPGGALPSAIATARNPDKSPSNLFATTDLYAIGNETLYHFPANAQQGAAPIPLVTNSIFSGSDLLLAARQSGVTTIWGKNGSDQVYYLSCPIDQLSLPGSWSEPVPILSGIERISAYVNMKDGGNTVFATGGGKFVKLSQATNTASKLWRTEELKISPQSPKQKSISLNSYTTTIQVSDSANDLPAKGVTLAISTTSRTPVYINGLYYVLGKTRVNVATDATGTVAVVEATEDINATILTVSLGQGMTYTFINPMEQSFQKLTDLGSEDQLRKASFPAETTAGGVLGPTSLKPLVNPSTSESDVQSVAAQLTKLKTIYSDVATAPAKFDMSVIPSTLFLASPIASGIFDEVAIAAGDLFNWLRSGVEHTFDIIYDALSDAWNFVATIAGKVYRVILDTVDAIVGAVEWVFHGIKTAIEDIIHFIEFLFEWDDIRRTKDVIHNVVKLFLQDQIDGIPRAKAAFDGQITAVEQTVNEWAGITDWSSLGDTAAKPATNSTSNPAKGQTSGSQLLSGHLRDNAGDLSIVDNEPTFDVVQNLVDDVLAAISNEGEVLCAIYDQLQELAGMFSSMSVESAIKALAGILVDGILSSVKVVADALLDVLQPLMASAAGLLDTKIHIPVISDILNAIGVPDISFLDLFTWIAAVAYTVVYKIAKNEPPFPDDSNINAIISATSWNDLLVLFQRQSSSTFTSTMDYETTGKLAELSPKLENEIFFAFHAVAGFVVFTSNFFNMFEAEASTGDNPFSIPSAVAGIIAAACQGGVGVLIPKDAIENTAVGIFADFTTTAVIASKIVFSGPAQKRFAASESNFAKLAVNDGRATGAIVNSILVIPALFVSGWHFYELSRKPTSTDRTAAILGEVSNLTSYITRISYALAVNDEEMESRQVAIGVMVLSSLVTAGLETAEALVVM